MMAVAVQLGDAFEAGEPEALFEGRYRRSFDVHPDGDRFLSPFSCIFFVRFMAFLHGMR